MTLLIDIGLTVGLLLLFTLPLKRFSHRVDRALTQVALVVFRDRVETEGWRQEKRKRQLQSVHSTSTYPVYASLTLVYSALVGVAGTLLAVWLVQQGLLAVAGSEEFLRSTLPAQLSFIVPADVTTLSLTQIFGLLLLSGATFGAGGAAMTHHLRWWFISHRATRREILIDESLPRTIAFIYALSRSGMVFPEIMRTVAANRKAFGETAEEIAVVVKDMDLFGADLVTAMLRTAERTPSEQFKDFAENFSNVFQSGQRVSEYLRDQYEQYQSERIDNQERLLELFTALGEAYVAGLVAGPLFLITILIIWGILSGGLLELLQLIIYLIVPLANLGFIVYLDTISEPLKSFEAPVEQVAEESFPIDVRQGSTEGTPPTQLTDGGSTSPPYNLETNKLRLDAYLRYRQVRQTLLNPVETVVRKPMKSFYVSVPIAVLLLLIRGWPMFFGAAEFNVRLFDDLLIQSGLLVVASFAGVQELHNRRIRRIENDIPDFLDRLASTNEAGMTFTESVRRVDKSDLGALNTEVQGLLRDIDWGARTERALHRFNERIGSSTIARVVALITNAMNASGQISPVIRIAASEAREDNRLNRKRRQEMFIYVMIIYLAFFVFLGIAFALQDILVAAVPTAEELGGVPAAGGLDVNLPINPAQGAPTQAYILLLFHATVIQSVVSGLIAGQMGQGSVLNGAKHVTIMLTIAYVVFLTLG